MVNVVSRTFPLNLMMKSMHFQVKKRLSFELQNVAVGLSSAAGLNAYPPLSAASARLAQRRIWQSISIKVVR